MRYLVLKFEKLLTDQSRDLDTTETTEETETDMATEIAENDVDHDHLIIDLVAITK